jgi:putative membrane protein
VTPSAPSLPGVLLDWRFEPLVLAALVATGVLYLRGVAVARARGRDWRWQRSACFLGGLAAILIALASPLATYESLFSVHAAQHMVLSMLAPPLLALGAPITLTLLATSKPVRRRLMRVVHSLPVKVLSHPLWAWLVFTLSLYGLYYSSLFALSLRNEVVHQYVHLHFLAAGLLFWWPIVGIDPSRWKLHPAARLGFLFLMVPFHAFLGVAIMNSGVLLTPELAAQAPAWADPLDHQQAGGGLLWGIGDLVTLAAAIGIMVAWANEDAKEARRTDRRLDAERAAASGPMRPVRPGERYRQGPADETATGTGIGTATGTANGTVNGTEPARDAAPERAARRRDRPAPSD